MEWGKEISPPASVRLWISSVLSLYALAAPADSSKFMGMELHFKTPEREVLTGGAI